MENIGLYFIIFILFIDLIVSYCIFFFWKIYVMFFFLGILLMVGVDYVVGRKGKFDVGCVDFLFVSFDWL